MTNEPTKEMIRYAEIKAKILSVIDDFKEKNNRMDCFTKQEFYLLLVKAITDVLVEIEFLNRDIK